MSEHDHFFDELTIIAQHTAINAEFADDLEKILRQEHRASRSQQKSSVIQWRIAVTVLISIGVIALLPPTRTLAVNILSFFIPIEDRSIEIDRNFIDGVVEVVATLEEAEAIAGFDAYVITDMRYVLRSIVAAEGVIALNYHLRDLPDIFQFTLYQYQNPPPFQSLLSAVPDDVEIETVSVNGSIGEYVSGYWIREDTQIPNEAGEFMWMAFLTQLRWQANNIQFHLIIEEYVAPDIETAVALAESVEPRP